eukprot:Em0018g849a
MKRADTEFSAARRQFVTTKADNKSLNDDAMLVITSSDEKSSLMSEGDAPTERDTHAARTIRLRTLERLRSRADLLVLSNDELELKTNMFYHISNPLARWKADRSPPIKMILQLLKTFCIVTQAVLFMQSLTGEQSIFENDAQTVFAKFLLPNSSPAPPLASRTTPYNTYDYTAYTVTELEEILNTACDNFYNSTGTLFGGYGLEYVNGSIRPIQVVLTQYVEAELNASDRSFVLNGVLNTTSFEIKPEAGDGRSSFQQFLDNCGPDNCFQRFVKMDMYFYAMNIKILTASLAQCYAVTVTIIWPLRQAVRKSYRLAKAMGTFYHTKLKIKLSWYERASLFEYWHLITVVSDLLIFPGSVIKIVLDLHYPCSSRTIDVDSVRIMLGVSVVLQAAVILRYVSYFRQFNALSSALDIAIPRLVKFFLCAGILFVAFMLCAWVVLGPFQQEARPLHKDEVHRFVFSGPYLRLGGVALRDLSITKHYVDPELIKCCSDDKRIT